MFIGHLPAGYLIGVLVKQNALVKKELKIKCFYACLVGAVIPDIDMLYFYFVDQRQHHHHSYLTHLPITWVALLVTAALWLQFKKGYQAAMVLGAFAVSGFVHLVLDTLVGDVWWLYPIVNEPISLFTVTARYEPWWLNFIFHWSFALEFLVWAVALLVWFKRHVSLR